ncbi:But2 multi-domain protein [Pyrenophora tritici-repentis]|nr:But2 multi-domain protein [Pyrenophora tritici-repentis]
MKTFAILSMLLATALAAPPPPGPPGLSNPGKANGKANGKPPPPPQSKCPTNSAQPDGRLPNGAISTSALVPIAATSPNTPFPSVEWAIVTPNDICTIFNLQLDSDATQGKICNLVFDFPDDKGLYVYFGSGHFTFTGYAINAGAVPGQTTYNNQPAPGPSPPNPPPTLLPGHSYIINSSPCGIPPHIGQVTVSGALCSKDTILSFKQSNGNGQCPMGFYVVLTDDPNAQKSS